MTLYLMLQDSEEEQKRIQEEQDRRLAEQIVLAEARERGYPVHGQFL